MITLVRNGLDHIEISEIIIHTCVIEKQAGLKKIRKILQFYWNKTIKEVFQIFWRTFLKIIL